MFFANRKVQRRKTALVGVGCSAYTSLTVEFDTSLSPCVSKISKLTSIEFIKNIIALFHAVLATASPNSLLTHFL